MPAKKLAELPAIQHALSTHGPFAKSACGLSKDDSSPRKKNPRLRIIRLIPAEIFSKRLGLFIQGHFLGYGFANHLPKPELDSGNSGVDEAVAGLVFRTLG